MARLKRHESKRSSKSQESKKHGKKSSILSESSDAIDPALGEDEEWVAHRLLDDDEGGDRGDGKGSRIFPFFEENVSSRLMESRFDTDNDEDTALLSDTVSGSDFETTSDIPSSAAISRLFQDRDMSKLSAILKKIGNKLPSEIEEYKRKVDSKERRGEKLIHYLVEANEKLQQQVKELKQAVKDGKHEKKLVMQEYETEIKRWKTLVRNSQEYEDELVNEISKIRDHVNTGEEDTEPQENAIDEINESKFNMLELLTGVRCLSSVETENEIVFTMKQKGVVGVHFYKLIIGKNESGASDLIYEPIWNPPVDFPGDRVKNAENVRNALPDYLHEELSFPTNSVLSFHSKISGCLNR